jgi:hypothetical protein
MIKFTFIFCAGLLLIMGFAAPEGNCKLEYDGLYYSQIDSDYFAYVKFYEDGTVLHTTSIEKIDEVTKFFTKEYKTNVLSGTYSFGKCNVSFNVFGKTGAMKFKGDLEGDTLYLKAANVQDHTSSEMKFAYYDPTYEASKTKQKTKTKSKSK